jgi:hypothetical protein
MPNKLYLFLLPSLLVGQTLSTQIDWLTQIKNKPSYDSREFSWYRTSGSGATGSLSTSGSGKVITLTPGPRGITTSTPLRIYNGTGTAEELTPSATTCSATVITTSCTVTVTTVNTHSGSWRVGTATAGLDEAQRSCGSNGCLINVPAGTYDIYSTIHIRQGVAFVGDGWLATTLLYYDTDTPLFSGMTGRWTVAWMKLQYAGATAAVSGSTAVYSEYSGGTGAIDYHLESLNVIAFHVGIKSNGGFEPNIANLKIQNSESHGIWIIGGEGRWTGVASLGNKGDGVFAENSLSWFHQYESHANGGCGFRANSAVSLIDFFINNDSECGLEIGGSGPPDVGLIAHGNIQFSGENPFDTDPSGAYEDDLSAPGLIIKVGPVTVDDVHLFNNNGNNIEVQSGSNVFRGVVSVGAGIGAQAGNTYGIKVLNTAGLTVVTGGSRFSSNPVYFAGGNAIITDSTFNTVSATVPTVEFSNDATNINNIFKDVWVANQQGGGTGPAITVGSNTFFHAYSPFVFSGVTTGTIKVTGTVYTNILEFQPTAFESLGTPADGRFVYCWNCNIANPCTTGGSGALAKRLNSTWVCN